MAEAVDLSVVIPAYCEERRLPASLHRIRDYLAARPFTAEIVLVDDGSADRTAEVAHEILADFPRFKVLRNQPNAGKGYSVRRGMLASQGAYALFTDADLSTPIEAFDDLLAAHERGADVAIGSRAMRGSDIQVHQPFLRETAGRMFNLFVRTFVLGGLHDTQCGFKSFTRRVVEPVFRRQRIERWGFDVEVLYLAQRLGFSIAEVPVVWRNDEATKINALSDGVRMAQEALQARRLHHRLTPADREREVEVPDAHAG